MKGMKDRINYWNVGLRTYRPGNDEVLVKGRIDGFMMHQIRGEDIAKTIP